MPFTGRVWTTDTAASLDAANYDSATDVTTNGRAYVVDNFTLLPTGPDNAGIRVSSGSLTIAENEVILTNQNQTDSNISENTILVDGGNLIIEGSANEDSPHTFVETMGTYNSTSSGNIHQSGAGAITLVGGNITIGSEEKPYARIISHKSFVMDPGDANIDDVTGSPASINIQTLILQNPLKDTITVDAQLPPLGFRATSPNYTAGASSFDTAILDGFNVLDVSGASSANSGMFPQNIVFRRGSIVGDNGSGARLNNLIGVAYTAVNGNTSTFDLIINTRNVSDALAEANWFVIGNTDGPLRGTRRFTGQRGGFVANRLITVNGASGGTDQRYWIPESNQRVSSGSIFTGVTAITGATDLGGIQYNPHFTNSGSDVTGQIPINGSNNRYSVVNATPGTQLRLRTQVGWIEGGTGVANPIVLAEPHQNNEYVYYGTRDLVVGAQPINYYQQGVVELEVSIPDAVDPFIGAIAEANRTSTIPATVTLPTLVGSSALADADKDITINFTGTSGIQEVQPYQLLLAVKNAMLERLATNVNTTTASTANDYVVDYLDAFINGGATWTITSSGVLVELDRVDADGTYNVDSGFGTLDVTDANVELVVPEMVRTFTIDSDLPGKYIIETTTNGVASLGAEIVKPQGNPLVIINTFDNVSDTYKIWWQPTSSDGELYIYNYAEWSPSEQDSSTLVSLRFDQDQALTLNATSAGIPYAIQQTLTGNDELLITLTAANPISITGDNFQTINWEIWNDDAWLLMLATNGFTNDTRQNGFTSGSGVSYPEGGSKIRFTTTGSTVQVGPVSGQINSVSTSLGTGGTTALVSSSTQLLQVVASEGVSEDHFDATMDQMRDGQKRLRTSAQGDFNPLAYGASTEINDLT